MTIDTSAIVAILLDEAERAEFVGMILAADRCVISTVTVLEATMVMESRKGTTGGRRLELFLFDAAVEIVPFDAEQLDLAQVAFRRYGKGRHRAALNFGDCASYALAQWSGEPLLFKGADFAATDVADAREVR